MSPRRKPLPPLNALKAFEAAARLRSLTRAAEELHVTQGAISQQVKLLEEYLGTQLFIRKPRKLELTDSAQAYLPILTEAFSSLLASTHDLFGKDQRARLTIKCGTSFMQRWLVPRLNDFYAQHPDLQVRLISSVWPSQTEVEAADLEISNGFGDWTGMRVERLTNEYWQVVASPAFLAHHPVTEDPFEIAECPLISTMGDRENWQQWFRKQGIHNAVPQPILESDTSTIAIDAACNGVGLLLARSFVVDAQIKRGELVAAHPFTLPSTGAHYLVLPNKPIATKVAAFCSWIKQRLDSEGHLCRIS
ncbi:LysR substrate-binding domain-containing protein [Neptunomonas marina]|uniref:LysR family transcriptional regulator n=1 Tax=Neptunomonas marina TaxID=1815562 RepID=A0A437Q5C4_9GAMM|nr:LysR substrate-binding domain-containing protein [Neptunomonas marina]RVU29702.1 LysR family transcriptional regulator [Neptunomonas marina]